MLTLLLGVLLTLNLGCQKKGDPDSPPATEAHPAITAANKILSAIHAGDTAAIRQLLNATNQEKISDDDLPELLKEAKEILGEVTEVTEVKKGRRENEVAAKIRVVEDEVFVVVLTLEEGHYLFEDLNSHSVAGYEALEKIAP